MTSPREALRLGGNDPDNGSPCNALAKAPGSHRVDEELDELSADAVH